jgi:DNA-binding MarR family transcriptional regulator
MEPRQHQHLAKSARLLAWTSRSLERACARTGLTLAKYRVLFLLDEGSLRSAELAILARIGAPTVTSLTEALERAGLVERLASRTDRRGVRVRITAAGCAALERTEHALVSEIDRLLDLLSDGYAMDGVAAIYERVAERCRFRASHAAEDEDPRASSFDDRASPSTNELDSSNEELSENATLITF